MAYSKINTISYYSAENSRFHHDKIPEPLFMQWVKVERDVDKFLEKCSQQ